MFKTILLIAFSLFVSSTTAFAQLPELNIERPFRRCGTSMLLEKEKSQNNGLTRAISANYQYVAHSGTVTIPVILVNFSDVKFTINEPKAAFEQMFNGTKQEDLGNKNKMNYRSVTQYFNKMSGNTFMPKFKVYGPVTVARPETYYGGTNPNNNSDERPQLLVKDALALIEDSVTTEDLDAFSLDGSSIESVYILYAGIDQNDNGPGTAVWANTWITGGASLGRKKVRWYTMSGELSPFKMTTDGNISSNGTIPVITGLGVACHEFSHALGLPDIYPTNDSAHVDNQEMEYWDLMDGGEYAGKGYYPTAYTAFEKNEMGWPVDIEELTANQTVTMSKSTLEGGTAYKIVNPNNSNEYFMLENITKEGWNSYQNGEGLLIYHVNRPSGDINVYTPFNNTPHYPGMAVVPADGAVLSSYNKSYSNETYFSSLRGDLFPGTGNMSPDTLNVTELSDAKPQPNFCWYDSNLTQKLPTNKALQNIKYSNGVVTFNYIHDVAAGINDIHINKPADNRIFTVDGVYMGTNLNALPHGVYIINGRKIVK